MRCEVAERELSARLDGAGERGHAAALAEHVAQCARCQAFEQGARRIRELARFEPVPEVPDLVPEIMAAVRSATKPRLQVPTWTRAAAVFVAGALAGGVLTAGLPGIRTGAPVALATEVPRRVAAAAAEVTGYRATFEIVEHGFHPEVEERRFEARIEFAAPERFRAEVRDRTPYPSTAWPRNDLLLAIDRDRWQVRGPAVCPREALPTCATGGSEARAARGREPFDGETAMPTDIVLPIRTLSGSDRVTVVGERQVLGRRAVDVELAYRDATPLFAYLHAGGVWRPFFPLDRVRLSLDAETWFPLAYTVEASGGEERERWASRNSLEPEAEGTRLLEMTARSLDASPTTPPASVNASGNDRGFRDERFSATARGSMLPGHLAGLRPYRAGRIDGERILSFTRGLSWLKVRSPERWSGPGLYGLAAELATRVRLPDGGVAYEEPATGASGRRVSVHAPGFDVAFESNLPRARLLRIAASLPGRGEEPPADRFTRRWAGGSIREHVSLKEALRASPGLQLPRDLPPEYRLASLSVMRTNDVAGVTARFNRPGVELDGIGLLLHQSPGAALPPPMTPDALSVRVRGVIGRYSPSRSELEWVEHGTYRSLRSETLGLAWLLEVASSLRHLGATR